MLFLVTAQHQEGLFDFALALHKLSQDHVQVRKRTARGKGERGRQGLGRARGGGARVGHEVGHVMCCVL